MKCEICHKSEAAAVLHRKGKDGGDEELYVCKECAAQARADGAGAKHAAAGSQDAPPAKVTFNADDPPPFVENFVKAALGLVEGFADQEKGKHTCPGCGRTWEQIKEEKRVGCPRCYRTFAESIRETFLAGAYGRTHAGAMPPGVTGKDSRAYLERALKAAVKRQQFEKAAELRRRLDALDGGEEHPGRADGPKAGST